MTNYMLDFPNYYQARNIMLMHTKMRCFRKFLEDGSENRFSHQPAPLKTVDRGRKLD